MPCAWLTMPLSERRERQSVLKQKVMRTTVEAYCRRFIEALEAPAVARAALGNQAEGRRIDDQPVFAV